MRNETMRNAQCFRNKVVSWHVVLKKNITRGGKLRIVTLLHCALFICVVHTCQGICIKGYQSFL